MKPADRLIAQLGYKAWPHPLIASLDRYEMFFDRIAKTAALICMFSRATCHRPAVGSASARHRLGFDSARAWNWPGIGSTSTVAPYAIGIVPESPSVPPRHRLSIGSTSPRHRMPSNDVRL